MLFVGTEFGIYWTPNGGTNWHKLSGGVPTISFRDLKIHRRDGDLVGLKSGVKPGERVVTRGAYEVQLAAASRARASASAFVRS